mgnify:CR=1 FL=1
MKLSFLKANIGYLEESDPKMISFITKLRNDIDSDVNHEYNIHPEVILQKTDKFSFNVYRQKKDPLGNDVKADDIIKGRTTYWCPAVQN